MVTFFIFFLKIWWILLWRSFADFTKKRFRGFYSEEVSWFYSEEVSWILQWRGFVDFTVKRFRDFTMTGVRYNYEYYWIIKMILKQNIYFKKTANKVGLFHSQYLWKNKRFHEFFSKRVSWILQLQL